MNDNFFTALPNFGVFLDICLHTLMQNDQGRDQGRQGNACGEKHIWGLATPHPKGRDVTPANPNFGGSPLLMRTPFDVERPNFGVPLCLCLHRMANFDVVSK